MMGLLLKILILALAALLSSSSAESSLPSAPTSPALSLSKGDEKTYSGRSSRNVISLTKCCPPSHLYKTALNYCRPSSETRMDQSWKDDEKAFLVPVHSMKTNDTLFYTDLNFLDNKTTRFQLNFNLISCPRGFLAKTSTKFNFYEDGTLKTDLDGVDYKFDPQEFCIDRTSISSDDPLIVRFCVPSKCDDHDPSGIHCIRKCCPIGSVINTTSKNCQNHSSSSSFSNDLNQQLREYRTGQFVQLDDFAIEDGVPPHCHNDGRQAFNMSQFYLLKDGRMYPLQ